MSKAAMNLQDSFLNQVRRENTEVKVLLVNGTGLRGVVRGFDNFTVILQNRNGQHLIYKHAIAQLVNQRQGGQKREGDEQGTIEGVSPEEASSESSAPAASAAASAPAAGGGQQESRRNNDQSRRNNDQGNNRPRKEGFNRLDLSSVRLPSENEEKVESK